ncbi:MAG: hypothetical protein BWZ10_03000 [candidate division BRC1 bacterium ADurb.BinA364]|nr:MAG: hypothetical protein BWZ10_03000 [candidate division BRC1 bacterium ADurb.BinA364]
MAWTASRASDAERSRLFDILDLPREETSGEHIGEAVAMFERHGAMQAARDYAARSHASALEALADAPAALRDLLIMAFDQLAKRTR